MNPIISEHKQALQQLHYENPQEELITKLYGLKKKFELLYYGKAECKKYDKARAFTIALNAALYEVNQLQSGMEFLRFDHHPSSSNKTHSEGYSKPPINYVKQIRSNIGKLEKELNDLIS